MIQGGLKQPEGAHHVRVHKGLRTENGAVHVGFRCKVDHGTGVAFLKQTHQEGGVPNVSADEPVPFCEGPVQVMEIAGIAGIGYHVQI